MIDDDHPIKSHRAKAWKKGYLAFSLHQNNPYKRLSTQFAWDSGWAAAKKKCLLCSHLPCPPEGGECCFGAQRNANMTSEDGRD